MQRQSAAVAMIALAALLAAGWLMGQEPEEGAVGDAPRDTRGEARTDAQRNDVPPTDAGEVVDGAPFTVYPIRKQLSVKPPGEPVVLAEEQQIVVSLNDEPPRERTVRFVRLPVEYTAVTGRQERETTGVASVYRVESVDDLQSFEWHMVFWVPDDQPQPTLMVDHEGRRTYFVCTTGRWIIVVPLTRIRTLDEALRAWSEGDPAPPGTFRRWWGEVLEADARSGLLTGPGAPLTSRIQHEPGPTVEALSRAEDGTWSIGLRARYRDLRITLTGQGDEWRVVQGN